VARALQYLESRTGWTSSPPQTETPMKKNDQEQQKKLKEEIEKLRSTLKTGVRGGY
jgi:hypothetical protein